MSFTGGVAWKVCERRWKLNVEVISCSSLYPPDNEGSLGEKRPETFLNVKKNNGRMMRAKMTRGGGR